MQNDKIVYVPCVKEELEMNYITFQSAIILFESVSRELYQSHKKEG